MDAADRLSLHELAALYGDVIDRRDWPGLAQVFTEDMVYANPTMPGRDLVGLEAVRRFMSRARHPLAHHITNVRVEDSPEGPILCSRVLLLHDDGSCSSGEYRDQVVKSGDGWRVRHRSFQARTRPEGDPPPPG